MVIEVKRSDAVRGSNDLTEIAERVSREPGWRFELVTLPSTGQAPAPVRIEVVEEHARQAMKDGHTDLAYVFASGVLEALLWDLALRHGLKVEKMPFAQIVRDLVTLGIVSRDVSDRAEQTLGFRNVLVHGAAGAGAPPTVGDVEDLLALARHLHGETAVATVG